MLKFRSAGDNMMILNDLIPRDEVKEGSLVKKSTGSTSGAENGETTDVICLRLCASQEKVTVYQRENITLHGISRRGAGCYYRHAWKLLALSSCTGTLAKICIILSALPDM